MCREYLGDLLAIPGSKYNVDFSSYSKGHFSWNTNIFFTGCVDNTTIYVYIYMYV